MRTSFLLAAMFLQASAFAAQPTEFWDAYRISLAGGPPSRALNVCSRVGTFLPLNFDRFHSSHDDLSLVLNLRATLDHGDANEFIIITDIASGTWIRREYTDLEMQGFSWDIALALSTLNYVDRANEPSSNVLDVTLCRPPARDGIFASCATLRSFITNVPGLDLVETTPCLASPSLDPADDLGDLHSDDVTPVLAPLLHVQTTASSVNWYLDGAMVGTSGATGGVASFRYPAVGTEGVHAYAAQHGPGGPISAPLNITIQVDALFRDAFETRTIVIPPLI